MSLLSQKNKSDCEQTLNESQSATFDVDTALVKMLKDFPTDVSLLQKDFFREALELQARYPGQWVAYIDTATTKDGVERLSRQVLCVKTSSAEVRQEIANHPDWNAEAIIIDYVDDPNDELETVASDFNE